MNNNSSKDVDVNIGQIDKKGSKMSKTHSRNVEIFGLEVQRHDGVQSAWWCIVSMMVYNQLNINKSLCEKK